MCFNQYYSHYYTAMHRTFRKYSNCLDVHSKYIVLIIFLRRTAKLQAYYKPRQGSETSVWFILNPRSSWAHVLTFCFFHKRMCRMNEWMSDWIPEASLHGEGQETLRLYEKWKSRQCEGRSDWSQLRNYQPQVAPLFSDSGTFAISLVVANHGNRFQLRFLNHKSYFTLFSF